ncbi:hypothetical protein SNE26_07675 [Mucilaginibacter sp. cycad4]|uniref:hypothetical protein n=1 Tax=Mucilaginibacter sp. cycad4 TaxID=3342096 RepID=UPI002AABF078|nr:hypothetical protein [Mucilaginibacter gossypii]WPV01651.1 hypothetical protein SNE26_07675 [Mucilaginibacter gossypii]
MTVPLTLIALFIVLAVLISLSGYLLVNNWSNETLAKTVPSVLFGLVALVATITFGAKESSSQKTFEFIYFVNPATNEILNPPEFNLSSNYEKLFSPNRSDNHSALQSYPIKIADLKGDEQFQFWGFANARVLGNILIAIKELNSNLMYAKLTGTEYSEDLSIKDLAVQFTNPSSVITQDHDFEWYKYNSRDMAIPVPKDVQIRLQSYDPSLDLSGRRDMVIFRENFFELRITAIHNGSGHSKKHGYGSIKLICATKLDKLTSQHFKTKTYKAYCLAILNLLEKRFNDPQNFETYFKKDPNWPKQ